MKHIPQHSLQKTIAVLTPCRGFSLMELLAVMAVLAILVTLVIPSLGSVSRGYMLTREGQILGDQIALARQLATSRNRNVELRIIQDASGAFTNWAVQIWERDPVATNEVPLNRKISFDSAVELNTGLSPLLTNLPRSTTGNETWWALRIRPNGRFAAQMTTTNSYLTLQPVQTQDPENPANYYTLQVNPLTGRITAYRP